MDIKINLKFEYWIINKKTNELCLRQTINIDANDVFLGIKDQDHILLAPVIR